MLTAWSNAGAKLLHELRSAAILRPEEWEQLPAAQRAELERQASTAGLLDRLVEMELLTEYQAARASAGKHAELILDNYRILDCLGAGGMGVVLKAEHVNLHRLVAIKVLRPG